MLSKTDTEILLYADLYNRIALYKDHCIMHKEKVIRS